jgi:Mrp family chromosome partitioning ATPase
MANPKAADPAPSGQGGCAAAPRPVATHVRREGVFEEEFLQRSAPVQARRIHHTVAVLSARAEWAEHRGRNLDMACRRGQRVGLLDVDIHGPSIPTMLGLTGLHAEADEEGLRPAVVEGVKVVSLGLLLPDADEAVIWRGPMKANVITQLLRDVDWGDLDFLVVDCPPGTGDEPLSVSQLIKMDGAVIVTTPQKVAAVDVAQVRDLLPPHRGSRARVVENMSGFACPKCGEVTPFFRSGGGTDIAQSMGVPFLAPSPWTRWWPSPGTRRGLRAPPPRLGRARVMHDIVSRLTTAPAAAAN